MSLDLEWSILGPALIAGLLVLSTHVPLGLEVLRRGVIFVDLAVAQFAGLGAIVATLVIPEGDDWRHGLIVQGAALLTALAGSALLVWAERRFVEIQEALIGCLFVVASSLALLLLAGSAHGAEHLKDLLAGQILWVALGDLVPVAVIYPAILWIWLAHGRRVGPVGFFALFALTVTCSVQLVGVYLVFANLIMPGLVARRFPPSRRLLVGYGVGAFAIAAGLVSSSVFDLATGPLIVTTMAVVAALGIALPLPGVAVERSADAQRSGARRNDRP